MSFSSKKTSCTATWHCGLVWVTLLSFLFAARLNAQVADDSVGVSVAVKLRGLQWNQWSTDEYVDLSVDDLNPSPSVSAFAGYDWPAESAQTMFRFAVGKTYQLEFYEEGLANGGFTAVPPPGYVVEINGVPSEASDFDFQPIVYLRVRPQSSPTSARAGVATALGLERMLWQVSLGSLSNGDSAGTLDFIDTGVASTLASMFSAGGLVYVPTSSEVQVLANGGGASPPYVSGSPRQIIAPQVCVDIVMIGANDCQLRFYHRAQLSTVSGGLYTFTGEPYAWYFLDGTTANTMLITNIQRDITDVENPFPEVRRKVTRLTRTGTAPNYTWTVIEWVTEGQTALTKKERVRSGATDTTQVLVPGGAVATEFSRSFTSKAWGTEVASETIGTSASVVTSYDYWDVSNQSAYYTRLRSQISHGSWEAYEYYDYADGAWLAGALKRRHRPFNNSNTSVPSDLSSHSGETTAYEYEADDFGRATRLTKMETKVNGVTTALSTIAYTETPNHLAAGVGIVTAERKDYSAGGLFLTTITKYFSEGTNAFFRSRPYSVQRPDGTKTVYVYQHGTWNGSTFTRSGNGGLDSTPGTYASRTSIITGSATNNGGVYSLHPSHDGFVNDEIYLVPGKTILQVTIRDSYARVVREETYVPGSGWELLSAVNYEWNLRNQLVKRVTNQSESYDLATGAIYTASYTGERLTSETDERGIVTNYTYDHGDRIASATQAAGGGISALQTRYSYDAAGHLTEQRIGPDSGENIVSSWTYDSAGRVASASAPGPNGILSTSYTYDPGNRQVTKSLPGGATRTETRQADGSVAQTTGTAVVPSYFTYQVLSGGVRYTRVNIGSSGSTRLSESKTDWLGRTTETSRPGFTGQVASVGTAEYDTTSGRLKKTTQTGYAPTLYGYDIVGSLARSALDLDSDNIIDFVGPDRVAEGDRYFEKIGSDWWATQVSRTYATATSGTALQISKTQQRLTGFAGNLRAETKSTDVSGNVTTTTVSVDRTSKTTTIATKVVTAASVTSNTATETIVNGLSTSSTGIDGVSVTATYDDLHRAISTTSPKPESGNRTVTTSYKTGSTYVNWIKDAANNTVATYGYDSAGRVESVKNADNKYTFTVYNTRSQVTNVWGSATYPSSYIYNSYGERTGMRTYRGGTGWDSNSWPGDSGAADETTWTYDGPSGLLASKTDAASKTVSYAYNARGQTAARTWARGVMTTYSYDGATGELLTEKYSGGAPEVTYTYNRSGTLNTVADVTGTRDFVYDGSNPLRLTAEGLDTFYGDRTFAYSYDGAGRPTGFSLDTPGGVIEDLTHTHAYSGTTGRFTSVASTRGASGTRTFSYAYKNNGLLGDTTVGDSTFKVVRGYEADRDLLTSLEAQWINPSVEVRTISKYDYVHNTLGQRYTARQSGDAFLDYGGTAGSIYRRFVYNGRGEVISAADYQGDTPTALGASPNAADQLPSRNFAYDFDNLGNRKTASRNGTVSSGVNSYATNELNQYTSRDNKLVHTAGTAETDVAVTVTGGGLPWATSDRAGRRFWAAESALPAGNGSAFAPLIVAANKTGGGSGGADLVRTDATRTAWLMPRTQAFTYDADGNLTSDGMWAYTYDAANRLIALETIWPLSLSHATRLEYKYDYLGRRVEKVTRTGWNGSTYTGTPVVRRYIYDGWNLVAELDNTTILRSYTWGLDMAGSLGATGGIGALLQITDHTSGERYFPTYDANGNIVTLWTPATGSIAAVYEYSPFGELLRSEGAYAKSNPFRSATKFTDDETGLIYYGYRYYSPSLGRFINRDPIEESGGLNLYGFAANDGVNGWDYLGMIGGQGESSGSSSIFFTPIGIDPATGKPMYDHPWFWYWDGTPYQSGVPAAPKPAIVTISATVPGGVTTRGMDGIRGKQFGFVGDSISQTAAPPIVKIVAGVVVVGAVAGVAIDHIPTLWGDERISEYWGSAVGDVLFPSDYSSLPKPKPIDGFIIPEDADPDLVADYFAARETDPARARNILGEIWTHRSRNQLSINRELGRLRELRLQKKLEERFGEANVLSQRTLRDANGNVMIDPITLQARRVDFVVLDGKGNVRFVIEATSRNQEAIGGKADQLAKEGRIRSLGGTYIRDPSTDTLYSLGGVQTRVIGLEPLP